MKITLKLVDGQELDYTLEGTKATIGRSNKCEVVVPHEGVSRQHLIVEVSEGQVFITDLGSTNGVLIDGERIQANVRTPFPLYLSLSFGAVTSAIIALSESPTNSVQNPFESKSKFQSKPAPDRQGSQDTATIKLELMEKTNTGKKRPPKKERSESEGKEKSKALSPVNFLAALVIIAAIFYFMNKKDPAPEPVTEQHAPTKAPKRNEDYF